MAEHRETFAEDVGSKLLLLACMLAVFGGLMLVLLPIGAALAPPPPAVTAPVEGPAPAAPATETAPAPTTGTESAAPAAAAAPEGPPSPLGAIFPGLIMLIIAAVLAALSGLLLGYAKARSEEARIDPATPH